MNVVDFDGMSAVPLEHFARCLHIFPNEGLERILPCVRHRFGNRNMVSLQLPNPSDPRALRIAAAPLADPSDRRPLALFSKSAGASKRTLERLFQEDVGLTFGKWRQQLRLMHAMRLLAEGAKVTHASLESGYSTPSAFISMFRKTLGTTPRLYFRTDAKSR